MATSMLQAGMAYPTSPCLLSSILPSGEESRPEKTFAPVLVHTEQRKDISSLVEELMK